MVWKDSKNSRPAFRVREIWQNKKSAYAHRSRSATTPKTSLSISGPAGTRRKSWKQTKRSCGRKHINGAIAVQRDILFGEFVTQWFTIYKLGAASGSGKKISASTQANYRTAINIHLFPAFAMRQMRAITSADLQAFMNSLSDYGKTLINDSFSVLRNCFALAYAQGIIDRGSRRRS